MTASVAVLAMPMPSVVWKAWDASPWVFVSRRLLSVFTAGMPDHICITYKMIRKRALDTTEGSEARV